MRPEDRRKQRQNCRNQIGGRAGGDRGRIFVFPAVGGPQKAGRVSFSFLLRGFAGSLHLVDAAVQPCVFCVPSDPVTKL